MLIDLYKDKSLEYKYTLTLCKPNRQQITVLNEAYNISYAAKFGDIDELTFKIPKIIQDNITHNSIDNPNYDLIKGDFLILMETNNLKKYFIIDKPSEEGGDKDIKTVTCYSQEIILNKKYLRLFKGTRQLYNPTIYYSWDNIAWTKYSTPLNATGKTHIYVKTKDFSNIIDVLSDTAISIKNYVNNGIGIDIHNSTNTPSHVEITIAKSGETGDGILNLLEEDTSWKIGYLDPFSYRDMTEGQEHNKYRTFDVSEKTWLDFIRTELETSFECIFMFDTENKKINIYSIDTLAVDKGLYISEANYLKKINKEPKFDEVYTRLHIYGKDNISINSVNSTGLDYIEDFSYYMNNGYMTDSLVNKINTYNALLESKKTDFSNYLSQISTKQTTLNTKENELSDLKGELTIILDNIDLAIQAGESLTSLNSQKASKQAQINSKQAEINTVNNEINGIYNSISALATLLDKKNNFTTEELEELDYFIKEKYWSNDNYSDSVSLFDAGKKALQEINQPTVEFQLDVVDLFSIIDCQYDWDKLTLGSLISVNYSKLGIDIQLKVIGYSHNVDGGLSVELSNKGKKEDALRHLTDGISNAISAGTTVGLNKVSWNKVDGIGDWVTEFRNSALDSSKNAVLSGRNQNIRIDERGIAMSDLTNPLEQLRIVNNCLAMTLDGWDSASLSATPHGLVARVLIGEIIMSNKLRITDEKGQLKIDGNLLQIIDALNRVRVKLGEYASGKYGLQLFSKDGNQVVLDEDGILQTNILPYESNLDSSYPIVMPFKLGDKVTSIRKAELRFKLESFRSFEKSVVGGGGGGSSVTSASGGGSTVTSDVSSWHYSGLEGDNHYIFQSGLDEAYPGGHLHSIQFSTVSHFHDISGHQHNLTINSHSHQVTIPSHSHSTTIDRGIFLGNKASDVGVYIDNNLVASGLSGDTYTIDVTQYFENQEWHELKFTSGGMGRIVGSLFLQYFVLF